MGGSKKSEHELERLRNMAEGLIRELKVPREEVAFTAALPHLEQRVFIKLMRMSDGRAGEIACLGATLHNEEGRTPFYPFLNPQVSLNKWEGWQIVRQVACATIIAQIFDILKNKKNK